MTIKATVSESVKVGDALLKSGDEELSRACSGANWLSEEVDARGNFRVNVSARRCMSSDVLE